MLYSPDDMVTTHEVFFRDDYPVPSDLRVVVDVGANIGISAAYFLTHASEARCYAFEPNPANLERLRRNLAGLEQRIVVSDTAVGVENGRARFGIEPTGRYGGLGLETGESIEAVVRDVNEVLKDILDAEGRIDLLKIDIEGFEVAVVESIGREVLENIERIYFEHHQPLNPFPARFELDFSGTMCRLTRRESQ